MIWATIIWAGAAAFLTYLSGTQTGRRQIAAAATLIVGWGMKAFVAVAPTIAVQFTRALLQAFEQNRDLMGEITALLVGELTGETVDPASISAAITGEGLGAAGPAIGKPIIDAVLAIINPGAALQLEDGQKNLERLLGVTMALSMQGWFTSATGDLMSLGIMGSAADLPDAVERGLGLNRIGRLAWRAPIKKAVEEPLTVALNRQYLFTRLTLAEATKAYHRGLLTDAQLADVAADQGFNPDRAAILVALAANTLSAADVQQLYRMQKVQHDDAITLLRIAGFPQATAEQLLVLANAREETKLLDEIAANARRLYKAGELDQEGVSGFLVQAGFSPDEVQLALTADQLALKETRSLSLAELQALLGATHITPDDFRARLTKMHYAAADIELLLAHGTKKLTPHQIVSSFIQGKLTSDQALAELEAIGYSATDAATFLTLHGRHLSEGQVLEALRQGLVTLEQARTQLLSLGYPADQVDLLLAFQKRVLSPAEVQAAQLRGFITEQDALQRLRALGYSQADAQLVVELQVRLLTAGQIIQAYADALISRTQAVQDLMQRGLTQQEANTVVTVFDRKQAVSAAQAAAKLQAAAAKAAGTTPPAGSAPTGP